MRTRRSVIVAALVVLALAGPGFAVDPSWPKEMTFGL
jgi:hypothetical protein